MKRLPFYPLFSLLRIVRFNGGLSRNGALHILTWLVKTTVLEPFRWVELARFERQVKNHRIAHHPVFILGHYRSGTTYLQRMLMKDGRLGHMSIFQSILPEIILAFEKGFTRIGELAVRLFNMRNPFHRIPFTWDFPGEDDVGMTALLSRHGAQWGMLFPKQMDFYFNKYVLFETATEMEKEQWKKAYMYLVRKLSLRNNGKRMVLKSPPNTARIRELLELFPDARFIFIHRNPYEVYSSTKRLWSTILDHYSLGDYRTSDVPDKIIGNYSQMMHRYLEQRALIPGNRLIEIAYEDLVHQPLPTLQRVYEQIGMDDFKECKAGVEALVEREKGYKRLVHSLDTEEQGRVAAGWSRYFEEWKYTI